MQHMTIREIDDLKASNYKKLATTLAINAVIMFGLTYSPIASFDHFVPNINRAYVAVIMVSAMALLMLFVTGSMYKNRRLNVALYVGFGLQFLRSMVPHHSSAILMCEESDIEDPEIVSLCEDIVAAQEREITQMQQILDRYEATGR